MVENKLFLSLAHQKNAEVLEKTFICTRCVEGFKESQGLTESVIFRNFIISEILFNRNSGSYLVDTWKPLILQRWVWNFDWKKTSETADRKNRRNSRDDEIIQKMRRKMKKSEKGVSNLYLIINNWTRSWKFYLCISEKKGKITRISRKKLNEKFVHLRNYRHPICVLYHGQNPIYGQIFWPWKILKTEDPLVLKLMRYFLT